MLLDYCPTQALNGTAWRCPPKGWTQGRISRDMSDFFIVFLFLTLNNSLPLKDNGSKIRGTDFVAKVSQNHVKKTISWQDHARNVGTMRQQNKHRVRGHREASHAGSQRNKWLDYTYLESVAFRLMWRVESATLEIEEESLLLLLLLLSLMLNSVIRSAQGSDCDVLSKGDAIKLSY